MADTPDGNGRVEITLKDVYVGQQQTTKELTSAIGDINLSLTKILGHIDAQGEKNRAIDRIVADYEGRLRSLERWRYALPTATILGIGSSVLAVLGYFHH